MSDNAANSYWGYDAEKSEAKTPYQQKKTLSYQEQQSGLYGTNDPKNPYGSAYSPKAEWGQLLQEQEKKLGRPVSFETDPALILQLESRYQALDMLDASDALLNINGKFEIDRTKGNYITCKGTVYLLYGAFPDAPTEGLFDWGKVAKNVIVGSLAVAGCIVMAIAFPEVVIGGVTISTIGGFSAAGGGMGIYTLTTMATDAANQSNTSAKDFTISLVGTGVSSFAGAFGASALSAKLASIVAGTGANSLKVGLLTASDKIGGVAIYTIADSAKTGFEGILIPLLSGEKANLDSQFWMNEIMKNVLLNSLNTVASMPFSEKIKANEGLIHVDESKITVESGHPKYPGKTESTIKPSVQASSKDVLAGLDPNLEKAMQAGLMDKLTESQLAVIKSNISKGKITDLTNLPKNQQLAIVASLPKSSRTKIKIDAAVGYAAGIVPGKVPDIKNAIEEIYLDDDEVLSELFSQDVSDRTSSIINSSTKKSYYDNNSKEYDDLMDSLDALDYD